MGFVFISSACATVAWGLTNQDTRHRNVIATRLYRTSEVRLFIRMLSRLWLVVYCTRGSFAPIRSA